jgi:transposase-like protein
VDPAAGKSGNEELEAGRCMAYRNIGVETKVDAVSRVLRGDRVTVVAREMELDRNSLSLWVSRAREAMRTGMKRKASVRGLMSGRARRKTKTGD